MKLTHPIIWLLIATGVVQAEELSPREIYEQVSPSVVMVMGHGKSGTHGSGGTGSIIRADGFVLTNAHVIVEDKTGKPYTRLSVYLKPGRVTGNPTTDLARRVRATVVAYSSPLDLALLKLEGLSGPLPAIELSDSNQTRIGDRVIAIGHPEQGGLWALTTGVISAEVDNFNGVNGKHVYQTETGLNRGNSGGPLVDGECRMVGVNTAIARVAADGLPITSISFSLKSSVAIAWLREQGRSLMLPTTPQAPAATTRAGLEVRPPASTAAPRFTPSQQPDHSVAPSITPSRPESPNPTHPYNLDRLISDRRKAEADLDNMILEMRDRMKNQ